MLTKTLFILIFVLFSLSFKKHKTHEKNYNNFYKAKILAQKINSNAPSSFYCRCKILWTKNKGIPQLQSCGYKIRKNVNRANRIEWEHIVPAWQFGHLKSCWKIGGRKNCSNNKNYEKIETDLHNLQPVIGEINADRSNFMYGQLKNSEQYQYGYCSMKIDFKNKIVEPPNTSKGAIARTYFYMNEKYNLNISKQQIKLFHLWDKKYPVTSWECKRDELIFNVQGNHNPYIYQNCIKKNDQK